MSHAQKNTHRLIGCFDPHTLLSWSPEEVFAFLVYYRQGTDQTSQTEVDEWSRAMIDAALSVSGHAISQRP